MNGVPLCQVIELEHNRVRLREPKSRALQFDFKAQPMLGCIGVAPAGDFAPTSKASGVYGGNLDFNRIVEGATVILPVYHPGALLFVGDGHARQAVDGASAEERMAMSKITAVKTVLLSGPCTSDLFLQGARKLRSAAFIEAHTDAAHQGN